ncbi:MAG: hypothetical protein WA384_07490 [Rhodomicrobium sp.]
MARVIKHPKVRILVALMLFGLERPINFDKRNYDPFFPALVEIYREFSFAYHERYIWTLRRQTQAWISALLWKHTR